MTLARCARARAIVLTPSSARSRRVAIALTPAWRARAIALTLAFDDRPDPGMARARDRPYPGMVRARAIVLTPSSDRPDPDDLTPSSFGAIVLTPSSARSC